MRGVLSICGLSIINEMKRRKVLPVTAPSLIEDVSVARSEPERCGNEGASSAMSVEFPENCNFLSAQRAICAC